MAYWKCKDTFKSYINVNGIANAIVTATIDGKSYSATADSNGYASIKVKKKGTYTVTSNSTLRVAHATIVDKNPVTAYYVWEKWNALARYSYNTEWKAAEGSELIEAEWSSHARGSNGMSFDDTTGNFTVSGTYFTLNQSYQTVCYNGTRNYGIRTFSTSQTTSGRLYNCASAGSASSISMLTNMTKYMNRHWYQVHNSYVSHYIKGDTDYGEATSTNIDAHPTDGRDSTDGYYYVAE